MTSLLVEIILVMPHYPTTGYATTSECGITESMQSPTCKEEEAALLRVYSSDILSVILMDQQSLNKTMNVHWHQATLRT